VGTEDVPASTTTKEETVNPVEMITELKQEAAELVRARVIEFQVGGRVFARTVAKADAMAFTRVKADIENAIYDGAFNSSIRQILPTLKVRAGFVYAPRNSVWGA